MVIPHHRIAHLGEYGDETPHSSVKRSIQQKGTKKPPIYIEVFFGKNLTDFFLYSAFFSIFLSQEDPMSADRVKWIQLWGLQLTLY